jgi:hypothetical protein
VSPRHERKDQGSLKQKSSEWQDLPPAPNRTVSEVVSTNVMTVKQ